MILVNYFMISIQDLSLILKIVSYGSLSLMSYLLFILITFIRNVNQFGSLSNLIAENEVNWGTLDVN